MKYNILVGTHHKTGTHWMHDVFRNLAAQLAIPFVNMSKLSPEQIEERINFLNTERKVRWIGFHDHSRFPESILIQDIRGLRMIRDPLDVVISAVKYHETTDAAWVHRKRANLGGKTVQEYLRGLESFDDKLRFEIDDVSVKNLREMEEFDGKGVIETVCYEDLIDDTDLRRSAALFSMLGFDPYEVVIGIASMWRHSLFGQSWGVRDNHVKDGSSRQHVKVYSPEARAYFDERFGALRARLGYGQNTAFSVPELNAETAVSPIGSALEMVSSEANTDKVKAILEHCIEAAPEKAPAYRFLVCHLRDHKDAGGAQRIIDLAIKHLGEDFGSGLTKLLAA